MYISTKFQLPIFDKSSAFTSWSIHSVFVPSYIELDCQHAAYFRGTVSLRLFWVWHGFNKIVIFDGSRTNNAGKLLYQSINLYNVLHVHTSQTIRCFCVVIILFDTLIMMTPFQSIDERINRHLRHLKLYHLLQPISMGSGGRAASGSMAVEGALSQRARSNPPPRSLCTCRISLATRRWVL